MSWNVFSFYVFVLTRINFAIEHLHDDEFKREHLIKLIKSRQHNRNTIDNIPPNGSIQLNQHDESCSMDELPVGTELNPNRQPPPLSMHPGYQMTNVCKQCHLPIRPNILMGPMKFRTPSNSCNTSLRYSSSKYFDKVIQASLLKHGTNNIDKRSYYFPPIALIINILISIIITSKFILSATLWDTRSQQNTSNPHTRHTFHANEYQNNFRIQNHTNPPHEAYSQLIITSSTGLLNQVDELDYSLWSCIKEIFYNDSYSKFKTSKKLNIASATLLFPGAFARVIKFLKTSKKFFMSKISNNKENSPIKTLNSYGHLISEVKQPINIVQTNLSYLSNLQTSIENWFKLFKECWSHKRSVFSFRKEQKIIQKINLIEGMSPTDIDLRFRMYYYNFIQFNDFYKNFFPTINKNLINEIQEFSDEEPDDTESKQHSECNSIVSLSKNKPDFNWLSSQKCLEHHARMETRRRLMFKVYLRELLEEKQQVNKIQSITDQTINKSKLNQSLQDIKIDTSSGSKEGCDILEEKFLNDLVKPVNNRKSNYFVARPIHRMHTLEMGILLFFLSMLYSLSILSILIPVLCAVMIEMDIVSFEQLIDYDLMVTSFLNLIQSISIFKTIIITLWEIIIILSIFDLFNFFSSCLICFSRARYLHMRLNQINDLCISIKQQQQKNKLRRTTNQSALYPTIKNQNQTIQSSRSSNGNNTKKTRMKNAASDIIRLKRRKIYEITEADHIDSINKRMEFMIELGTLCQKELTDIKKFFTSYLNMEIAFKAVSMAILVTALLENVSIFELIYLVIMTNASATPIIIILVMASLIESQLRAICKAETLIMINGSGLVKLKNIKRLLQQTNYFSVKSNRSLVIIGNISLTLGSLAPVIGWIATGVVLLNH